MSQQQWIVELGPRQVKPVKQILYQLSSEHNTFVELLGVVGNSESEKRYVLSSPFSGIVREDVTAAIEKLKAEFEPITVKNKDSFLAAAQSALIELAANRPVHDKRNAPEEIELRAQQNAAREAALDAKNNAAAECWKILESIKPANATALIVAEHQVDDSDTMTDYHASHSDKAVAIGWRTGSREDFRQLRAAAANFPPTADYAPGNSRWQVWPNADPEDEHGTRGCGSVSINGETLYIYGNEEQAKAKADAERAKLQAAWDAAVASGAGAGSSMSEYNFMKYGYTLQEHKLEHRENYSMGAGNYLGDGKYSGWIVKSYGLQYGKGNVVETEHLVNLMAAQKTAPSSQTQSRPVQVSGSSVPSARPVANSQVTVSRNEEKNGVEIRFTTKPAEEVLTVLKKNGFRWSKFSSVWYKAYSDDTLCFANNLAAILGEQSQQAVA